MISKKKPESFSSKMVVVSCFCEKDGKHLLLQRTSGVFMPGRWGPPAGKVDSGEELLEALQREVFEETGIDISGNPVDYIEKYYVTHAGKSFVYHVFRTEVSADDIVLSSSEHQDYCWASPQEALSLPLIHDQDTVVREYYQI